MAENIVLVIEKIVKKANLYGKDFNADLKIFIFDFPVRILGNVVDNFQLGREGLMINYVSYKGFLFPSKDYKDKIEFLEELCKEAGLTKDSWTSDRASFYSFRIQEL